MNKVYKLQMKLEDGISCPITTIQMVPSLGVV